MKSLLEKRRVYADPTCTRCEGAGMYLHPEGGAAYCDCHHNERKRVFMRNAEFPTKHIGSTVAGYAPENEAERIVKKIVSAWVKKFKPGCSGLYLYGAAGTGKTHLLVAIGKAIIDLHGAEVCYVSAADIIAKAKARFNRKDGEAENTDPFEEAADADVLLLDDIGAEKPSEWVLSEFYRLFNRRYNDNLTTLLTSNVDLAAFEKLYDARIADRLHEMCSVVHCNGPSRRRGGVAA